MQPLLAARGHAQALVGLVSSELSCNLDPTVDDTGFEALVHVACTSCADAHVPWYLQN